MYVYIYIYMYYIYIYSYYIYIYIYMYYIYITPKYNNSHNIDDKNDNTNECKVSHGFTEIQPLL